MTKKAIIWILDFELDLTLGFAKFMLIDTHAHLNFAAFKNDVEQVIKRALENEVLIINIGSQFTTSRRAIEISNRYGQGVYAAIGLHPIHLSSSTYQDPEEEIEFATRAEEFDYDKYKELAQNPKVVAIGEAGLDYYHIKNQNLKIKMQNDNEKIKNIKKLQREVFLKQLDLARELGKPVIIHCREAHNDLIEILNSYFMLHNSRLKGVVHCFSGSWSQAEKYLEMGFFLSFTGVITYSESYNKVIINTPIEKILVETDCPYLAPIPFRGSRNEPLYVEYVARRLAEIKNLKLEEVARVTTQNALDLFGLEC
jgi:TatD DNase family protein